MSSKQIKIRKGSVLIETIIATTLFILFSSAILGALIQIRQDQYNTYLYNRANQLLQEGMEGLISIKSVSNGEWSWNENTGFESLTDGIHYLAKDVNDDWILSDTPEIINNNFNRKITIEEVKRLDAWRGNIDTTGTGETLLPWGIVSKKVTIEITFPDFYENTWHLSLTTYLINWASPYIFSN